MTAATHLYRAAARAVAPLLAVEGVRTVYVRRSVAAGDARFPWSDLDLAVVLNEPAGADLLRLWELWRIAQALFPRMGECQVFAPGDLAALAETDPYRASLDRRFGYVAWGERHAIPERAVDDRAAARRLVFWFQRYLPEVMRKGRVRDQRKIALEMYNALGVLEQRWEEPLATRAETEARARRAGLLAGDALERPFVACCLAAEQAAETLSLVGPKVSGVLNLDGLTVLPRGDAEWSVGELRTVATPSALQMLLELHDPFLWLRHGAVLASLGFTAPSRRAWLEAAARTARADQLRTPGFMGKQPQAAVDGFALAECVLLLVERGGEVNDRMQYPDLQLATDVSAYYRDHYDELARLASATYQRARDLLASGQTDSAS